MNTKLVILIGLVAIILVSSYVYITYLAQAPSPTTEVKLNSLTLSPLKVVEGKSVTVKVNASNVELESATSTITLKVNGTVESSQNVQFNAGQSKIVSFTDNTEAETPTRSK